MSPVVQTVTYSPAYTLVPTYECFNRCAYCNFRAEPGTSPWLSLAAAEAQLQQIQTQGVIEVLVLSGEVHPQSVRRAAWLQHIVQICELALSVGLLPHTNVGPLSFTEMATLKTVNVSMGLMLEQVTPILGNTVHQYAPSKRPEVRLQQLAWAGELQIPFTTGLLLGIGETVGDRVETLEAIADLHQQWGHIQEVILQPYSPGQEEMLSGTGFTPAELLEVIAIARQILPSDIAIQIPPNLLPGPEWVLACVQAGASDLGGIGPIDEVNPDYPHLHPQTLAPILAGAGWQLLPRLPIYPAYDRWLEPSLQALVQDWRTQLKINREPHPGI